ncbi:MAG: oligopeptide transporter, OPT family [Gemmatimonadaceae bacterium]|nr:oligopeptide transporter, OPT family [Gemmatimonadaceae bacterium]
MRPRELTLRGLLLGAVITTAFTAANVYLGLKVGLTFASSIPAAVISMAVLSAVKDSSILENNIVQTVASAAGTLSAIIFVLPGLVIVGWWTGFPFWQAALVCVSGGVLGVLFTIPLRRALVTHSDLPYPEGVAAAEVLKVGSGTRGDAGTDAGEAREGLVAVVLGSVASAGLAIVAATRVVAAEVSGFFAIGGAGAASGYNVAFSLALLGAGHLVGLSVGLAMGTGLLIAWAAAVPILTWLQPAAAGVTLAAHASDIWRLQVRFIGAGTIGVAAIWTLAKLARPVIGGLVATLASSRGAHAASDDEHDRDLPASWIIALTIACVALAAMIAARFIAGTAIAGHTLALTMVAVPFIIIGGFVVAAICGYMAGLIGASNSPISGVGILSIVACASILVLVVSPTDANRPALIAYALFVTAIVFACATISNDNLQDLKTGQLVGAAPWRQQVALIVGVCAGALVIPPILNLLAHAYGFAGAANIGVVAANPLPAPQATLIAALAQGVVGGNLDWKMIGVGGIIGAVLVAIDEALGAAGRRRVPPLAVGIGIYLPMSATFAVVVGAVMSHWYSMRTNHAPAAAGSPAAEAAAERAKRAERLGVLVASGLIVGESLFGVVNAGMIVATSSDAPIALVPADFAPAPWLGVAAFAGLIIALYGWMLRRSGSSGAA